MTTRTGARVYRGAPRPRVDPEACVCGRTGISLTTTGRRRLHRDPDGVDCPGSGVKVERDEAVSTEVIATALAQIELEESRWRNRDRSRPANPWSGKP